MSIPGFKQSPSGSLYFVRLYGENEEGVSDNLRTIVEVRTPSALGKNIYYLLNYQVYNFIDELSKKGIPYTVYPPCMGYIINDEQIDKVKVRILE